MALADFLDRLGTGLGQIPAQGWFQLAQGLTSTPNFAKGLAGGLGALGQTVEQQRKQSSLSSALEGAIGNVAPNKQPFIKAMAENYPEALVGPLAQSIFKPDQGTFFGDSISGQAMNLIVRGQKDPAFRSTPEYAMAWASQTQPRVVQDAQGRSVLYTPPAPDGILPPTPQASSQGALPQSPQASAQGALPQAPAASSAPQQQPVPTTAPTATPAPSRTGSAAPIPGLEAQAPPGSPMMLDVRGPDGTLHTVLGQQLKSGQWVSADEKRTPLGTPEGVTPPGGSGRYQVQAGRVMSAAEDVLRTVKTINAMPITASTGPFGLATAKTSFLGAPLNYLRQTMSTQDVQSYNALSQGLARSVVTIENQGLAPTDGAIASAAAQLMVQPGDTYLTRIQKQAEFRQHTEAHLTPMLHGPMTTPEQKEYIRKVISDLHEAIPYTVQDIISYSQKPGTMTFSDYARNTVLRGKPKPPVVQEYVPGGPPAGAQPSTVAVPDWAK